MIHGIGTDIVDCLRIAQLIERHGELFLWRVFTPNEIEYCSARTSATQQYAGHWAAKEAIVKAVGANLSRGLRWRDIEVRHHRGGGPYVLFHGNARETVRQAGVHRVHVSISHCRTYAVAYSMAESP
jgi:holo-[acyl-carrier protein] synthase